MKRKMTLFLSAVMAASCLPMTAYAANFKDIDAVPWAKTVVTTAADRGLVSGYEDNTFRAGSNVTYCEAMTMAYKVLQKTGTATYMDASKTYTYMQTLTQIGVPTWCQTAVAYGLENGLVDMKMVVSKFTGGTKTATREDVAIIFGNAMGVLFGKEKDTSAAAAFADYWNISADALEQVSMLKKMGIISGDDYNRFNPKNNINRAEMAVILNHTYELLQEGVSYSGEIVELNKNTGNDGTNYYYIAIKTEEGHKEGFSVTEGELPVYVGNTTQTTSLSQLSEGDDVVFLISGNNLVGIRLMKAITNQGKYDVTGYVNSVKDNVLSLENENTGETQKYQLDSGAACYVEGVKVKRSELKDILAEHYKDYAYAGMMTEVKREKVGGTYQNVTYVDELYITFVQEYTMVGKVEKFNASNITLQLEDGSANKDMTYAAGCKFYIADKEVTFAKAKELADNGTVYAKVTVNAAEQVTAVAMSEDTFTDAKEQEESKSYKLSSISDKKLILKDGSDKITYEFGTKNPLENIQFYKWDNTEKEWDDTDVDGAESYAGGASDDYYVRVTFNRGGKLSEVYISSNRNAWKNDTGSQTERKGTVASVKNGELKFQTSTVAYKMLSQYNKSTSSDDVITGTVHDKGTVAYPLNNTSAVTSSLKIFEKMANDSNLELYAEITANGDNEVLKVEARLKAAEGKLVEFNRDERYIEIKTADGNTFKLVSQRSPKLTDEVEDKFELEDLEGNSSVYIGETVTLGFTSGGEVNQITVGSGAKENDGAMKVKGIATAANNGLKVEGDSTTYRWKSKTSDISISNYSGPAESLSTVKALIEDPDVEVYVEATLEESVKGDYVVDAIKIYVTDAEGTLKKYDDTVRITTESGNTFGFYANAKLDNCNVNGYGQEDLKEKEKGIGSYVILTFDKDGDVCAIEGA